MTDVAARLRVLLLQMVIGVFALHGAAIALYLLTPVRHSTGRARAAFLAAWTIATLAVVLSGLHRIRAARAGARRAAPGTPGPRAPGSRQAASSSDRHLRDRHLR